LGKNLLLYGESPATLKNLIDILGNIPLITAKTANSDQIEKYLEVIMSYPKESSNPHDYIKAYSILPVSKKEIKGLYNKIVKDYGSNQARSNLLMTNLIEHLKANNKKNIFLNKQLVN
jgi:hypothetical protein